MKILWHYNSHRHFEEYSLSSEFFNRSNFLRNNAHVLVTCNNDSIDLETLRNVCKYKCDLNIVKTTNPTNGVHTGQFVAINETFHMLKNYDFVIHTTPDVYIVNDEPLIKLLNEEYASESHMVVDYHPYHPHCEKLYCTDFFIFKPQKVYNFFGESFEPTPDCHSIETHLYRSIHAHNIPHRTICRGRSSLLWQVDDLGLIHNHNLSVISDILMFGKLPDEKTAYSHNYVKTK